MIGVVGIGTRAENGLEGTAGGCAERLEKPRSSAFGAGLSGDVELRAVGQGEGGDVEGVAEGMLGKLLQSAPRPADIGRGMANGRDRLLQMTSGEWRDLLRKKSVRVRGPSHS